MSLSRDDILKKAGDLKTREVSVPGWDEPVIVRELTGTDRDSYEASFMVERPVLDAKGKPVPGRTEMVRKPDNYQAKLVARAMVDSDGNRLFTDADAGALGQLPCAVITPIFEAAAELSGLGENDVEQLAGNSEAAQSGDSSSTSPESSDAPSESFSPGPLPLS